MFDSTRLIDTNMLFQAGRRFHSMPQANSWHLSNAPLCLNNSNSNNSRNSSLPFPALCKEWCHLHSQKQSRKHQDSSR